MIDFASPQWFILLLILPFLVGLKVWSRTRSSRGVDAFVAKRLQTDLVSKTPAPADWIAFGLQLLGIALLIAATARPQWGFRETETITEGRNVIIAIDTSNSMLAEDLQPNRLTRAKLAAQDLVRNLPTDRIGLIAFAGKAFAQAPLTVDHEAVLESIDQLDTEVISRGGTNLTEPAILALETMEEAETSLAALVIFSDGEDLEGNSQIQYLREQATESSLLIVAVGVGTESGGIIPDPMANQPGVFIKDQEGNIVRSRLDPVALRQLADMTDGVYLNMGNESIGQQRGSPGPEKAGNAASPGRCNPSPNRALRDSVSGGNVSTCAILCMASGPNSCFDDETTSTTSVTQFFIRSIQANVSRVGTAGLLFALFSYSSLSAADEGLKAYQSGNFEEAQAAYMEQLTEAGFDVDRGQIHLNLGAAAYQSGDFEGAKHAFAQALLSKKRQVQATAHYNLGNSLFQTGRTTASEDREKTREHWNSAIEHYESALKLNSRHNRARRNLEFIKQQLDNLQDPPPQDDPNDDENEDNEDQKDDNQDQNQDENENEEKQNDQPPPPPDGGEDEQQQPPPAQPPPPEPQDQNPEEQENPEQPQESQPPPPRDWSPDEARRILENNADEDKDANPAEMREFTGQTIRNW